VIGSTLPRKRLFSRPYLRFSNLQKVQLYRGFTTKEIDHYPDFIAFHIDFRHCTPESLKTGHLQCAARSPTLKVTLNVGSFSSIAAQRSWKRRQGRKGVGLVTPCPQNPVTPGVLRTTYQDSSLRISSPARSPENMGARHAPFCHLYFDFSWVGIDHSQKFVLHTPMVLNALLEVVAALCFSYPE